MTCRVMKQRDGSWTQEEIVIAEGGVLSQQKPLGDPLIEAVLKCALKCQIPAPPLWERLYDMAVGASPSCTTLNSVVGSHCACKAVCSILEASWILTNSSQA